MIFFQLYQFKIISRSYYSKIKQNLQQLMYFGTIQEPQPKCMFLDQNSEEIRDKRIIPDVVQEQLEGQTTKKQRKKISNTIPLGVKLCNSSSIHNIEYSSKYGVLLLASDNEVVVKTTDELQEDLITQCQNPKGSMSISFSGELFLSPDEETVAICSESLMQFVKTSNLGNPNNIEVPPIPNLNEANHYLWVDNTHFLCWKFQGTATLYTIDSKTLNLIGEEEELEMEEVTGASVIHEHLFLISKMIIKIYEPLTGKAKVKSEIDMTDPHHDSPYFQYSYIIDVFKINIKEEKFTEKDVFGFVVVFYDVDDDTSDERFLTFARGDIFNQQSLEIRGYENFYSTKTSKELFYNDDQEKLSFSVKRIVSSGLICIMLEKSEKLYVVDPLEEFDRLNVYNIKSKHELKNQEGKFLQGMALMRNMLKIQRSMPQKGDEFLGEIVKKYNGEFMSLYFKDKETSLTIAFPASILAVGGDKFYKRYAISSVGGIEGENNQQIFEKLANMKRSPHILQAGECKKIGEKSNKNEEPAIKITQSEKTKQEKKKVERKQQIPKEEPKKEEKKQEPAKTAGDLFKNLKIFSNTPNNLLGDPIGTIKTGAPLFGNPTADSPKPLFHCLFGTPPLSATNYFEKVAYPSSNPPVTPSNPQTSLITGSLLDKPANATSLCVSLKPQANETTTQTGSNPCGISSSPLFGNTLGSVLKLADLFKNNPSNDKKDEVKVNIFAAGTQQTQKKPLAPTVNKSTVEAQPKLFPAAKKEQKSSDIQPKKQEQILQQQAPTNINSALNLQIFKVVSKQGPLKKEQYIHNQYKLFASKPHQTSLDKPINNHQLSDQQKKRNGNLNSIHKKLTNFTNWQKKNFNQFPYELQQTDYLSIKQKCDLQYFSFLKIRLNTFDWDIDKFAKFMKEFARKTQYLIISHDEFKKKEIFSKLNKHENISNKMLYYSNLLGKKKTSIRAPKPQDPTINKDTNILNRLIHQNEEKIKHFKQVSYAIRKRIDVLNEQKKKMINDIEKQFCFQNDLAQEPADQKKINQNPKQEIQYTIVQHKSIDKISIIQLPKFTRKHEKTSDNIFQEATSSQIFGNKQTINLLSPKHSQSQIPKEPNTTKSVLPYNPFKQAINVDPFKPFNISLSNYIIACNNGEGKPFKANDTILDLNHTNTVTPDISAHLIQMKK